MECFAVGSEGEGGDAVAFFKDALPEEESGIVGIDAVEFDGEVATGFPVLRVEERAQEVEGSLSVGFGFIEERAEFFGDHFIITGSEEVGEFGLFVAWVGGVKGDGFFEGFVGGFEFFFCAEALCLEEVIMSEDFGVSDLEGFLAFFPESIKACFFVG